VLCCAGNPIKFGLGLVSIGFDFIFMLQHYVWFHPDKAASKDQLLRWQQQQEQLRLQDQQQLQQQESAQQPLLVAVQQS
jgi:predicted DNA-binding protein (UPF0251 family)